MTAEDRERLRRLLADLSALAERQRSALVMHELGGLSHREIALALDCSEGATKQLVYEARAALAGLAAGRDLSCEAVRREISARDGRRLRSRSMRSHLRYCSGCTDFRLAIDSRGAALRLLPPLPIAVSGGLLASLLPGGGSAAGGAAAVGAGGGAGAGIAAGTTVLGASVSGAVAKGAAIVAALAVAVAGVEYEARTADSASGAEATAGRGTGKIADGSAVTTAGAADGTEAGSTSRDGRSATDGAGPPDLEPAAAVSVQAPASPTPGPDEDEPQAPASDAVTEADAQEEPPPTSTPPNPSSTSAEDRALLRELKVLLRQVPKRVRIKLIAGLRAGTLDPEVVRQRILDWLETREEPQQASAEEADDTGDSEEASEPQAESETDHDFGSSQSLPPRRH